MTPSIFHFSPNHHRMARILCVSLLVLFLAHCKSTKKPKYEKIDYAQSKLATPPHDMARHDYPFDDQGRYRTDWVRKGSSSSSSRSSSASRSSAPTYSAPAPARITPPKPAPPPKPVARYHTVKSGDTLFGMSKRYGTSVPRLKSVNGLTSDLIRIGQTLRIP